MGNSYQAFLDIRFSDFVARHIFSAKLRLFILLGMWSFAVFYVPSLLTLKPSAMLIFSFLFLVTTISYVFILRGTWTPFFFGVEMVSDVAGATLLVYLTGGTGGYFWTVYILYTLVSGLFYNWRVATVSGVTSLLFYTGLTYLMGTGVVQPFPEISLPGLTELGSNESLRNGTLLALCLMLAVYGVRLASYFTRVRETALEAKNRELMARNQIASMTRGVLNLEKVIRDILKSCREGLLFDSSFLVLLDRKTGNYRLHAEKGGGDFTLASRVLGFDVEKIEIPAKARRSPIIQAINEKRTVIRYELSHLSRGMTPEISGKMAREIQTGLGYGKFIVAPLIAEKRTHGALVGITQKDWIEEEIVRTFEGFADQAALVIENQRLIDELEKKNVELEKASRAKSDFLAAMSHELRTPLNAILGFSDILEGQEFGELNQDQQDSLQKVKENADSLLGLINGLLDLSKIEAGKMELQMGPVSLADLVTRVDRMMTSLSGQKKQTVEIVTPQEFPILYADETKVQQILLNLLSNAIKFTPHEGKIRIQVRRAKASFKVTVSDNGVGIPKEELNKVFDFFHQVGRGKGQGGKGTGLGLALTKQFVELHGGEIIVNSEEGKGAEFTFSLPARTH